MIYPAPTQLNGAIISPFTSDSLFPEIVPYTYYSLGINGAANRAYYIPFTVHNTLTIQKAAWFTSSSGTDSIDVGVYGSDGTRLGSIGSTALSGTNAMQSAALSLTLTPGLYYLATAMNGTTNSVGRLTAFSGYAVFGICSQSTAFPLPATATLSPLYASLAFPAVMLSTKSII